MIKKIWKDPVWSKVIAAGILAAIVSIGTYLFGVWPAIGNAIISLWHFIVASTTTPNWILGLMAIPSIFFYSRFICKY